MSNEITMTSEVFFSIVEQLRKKDARIEQLEKQADHSKGVNIDAFGQVDRMAAELYVLADCYHSDLTQEEQEIIRTMSNLSQQLWGSVKSRREA